jgi:fructose-1-phosphate kinase PfkB-like protein
MAARELGSEVHLLGFWAGPTGNWIRTECDKLGIACGGTDVAGWSRSCITLRTESQSQFLETELLGHGPTIGESSIASFRSEFERNLDSADVVAMSGSWPLGAGECAYFDLISKAHTKRKPVIVDCTGATLKRALGAKPYAVHLNLTEAKTLLGVEDPAAAAKQLSSHCHVSIVTAGKDGAFFAADGGVLFANCNIETSYGSVGSGDCLVAGFALAISRKLPLGEAASLACACGAANCLRRELGMLHAADVAFLLPRVSVRRLS